MTTTAANPISTTPWELDVAHSHVEFAVKHMMISTVKGRFATLSGVIAYDENDPTRTTVDVSIDVASIDTRMEARDQHLRSADFFDAATYPTLHFVSKRVERTDDDAFKLVGDLTIRDVTKEVVLDVNFEGSGKNPWGKEVVAFSAKGKLDRTAFGLNWNAALETGGILVGNEVKISIDLELTR